MLGSRLTAIDDDNRSDHHYLTPQDDCYFFLEYMKGRGFDYSPANSFINNLKKGMEKAGTYEWPHKLRAIREAAQVIRQQLPANWRGSTFVPIPPSKHSSDPQYDDRMAQILNAVGELDVRELLYQTDSMEASHALENRHSVDELYDNFEIDEGETDPEPNHLIIVDDVLTAGAHFRAAYRKLTRRFRGTPISGLFLSRRVFAEDD